MFLAAFNDVLVPKWKVKKAGITIYPRLLPFVKSTKNIFLALFAYVNSLLIIIYNILEYIFMAITKLLLTTLFCIVLKRVYLCVIKVIKQPIKIKTMNTTTNNLFKSISEAETKKLTTVVNETLALDINQHKTITAAELWNIQRKGTSMLQRRRYC